MLNEYYVRQAQHKYLNIENYDLIILDHLKKIKLKNATVLEIGAGFGRYTKALSLVAGHTYATEPNDYMFEKLKEHFYGLNNISLVKATIEEILTINFTIKFDFIFMFHVLHHLPETSDTYIKRLLERWPYSNLIILEPNDINPLFFLQVLFTRDMKFKYEKGMFVDNTRRLIKNHFSKDYINERKYIGLFPPKITRWLSSISSFFSNSSALSTKSKNPISTYSLTKIGRTL